MDQDGAVKWREFLRTTKFNYPTLTDEKGLTAAQYNISGYPHKFIIGRDGRLVFEKRGFLRSDENEIETEILKALGG